MAEEAPDGSQPFSSKRIPGLFHIDNDTYVVFKPFSEGKDSLDAQSPTCICL
jgi:hypothetical protein